MMMSLQGSTKFNKRRPQTDGINRGHGNAGSAKGPFYRATFAPWLAGFGPYTSFVSKHDRSIWTMALPLK
jgi:hypothetical protein